MRSPSSQYNEYIDSQLSRGVGYSAIELFGCETRAEAAAALDDKKFYEDWDEDLTLEEWSEYVRSFKKHDPRPFTFGSSTIGSPRRAGGSGAWREPYSSWSKLKRRFKNVGKMSEESIANIENSAESVWRRLAWDTREDGCVKGLVYGSVQSGKTANMEALISMAADDDWNIFIILTGTIENLRIQTRDRFKRDLCPATTANWIHLDFSGDDKKFKSSELKLNATNSCNSDNRYVITCLKQKSRLTKLLDWLYSDNGKTARMRIVILDDEADQASVNTAPILDGENADEFEQDRKAINRLIVNLANGKTSDGRSPQVPFQAVNYISFTATPYANVLNERPGESLYPKDFVHSLMDPREYFGCNVIFGNPEYRDEDDAPTCPGLDVVRIIPQEEVKLLKSIHAEKSWGIPSSFERSVCWFLCAAAALRLWGWRKPISMLIHTSGKTKDHFIDHDLVKDYLTNTPVQHILRMCRDCYREETLRFTFDDFEAGFSNYGSLNSMRKEVPAFNVIEPEIEEILANVSYIEIGTEGERRYSSGVHLCIDNCKADQRSPGDVAMRVLYPTDEELSELDRAPVFIVVGGNTLSRGLTIEGLVCTYFARSTNQADTLMQMARWFGYRFGYELLQRIWLTHEAQNKYRALAKVDMNLKAEIKRFEEQGLRPESLGVKVSAMPEVARFLPTSKNKMQSASGCEYNFTGYGEEITTFDADPEVQRYNLAAMEAFLDGLDKSLPCEEMDAGASVWRGVLASEAIGFVKSLRICAADPVADTLPAMLGWLSERHDLALWNVAVAGKMTSPQGLWKLTTGRRLRRIERSKIPGSDDSAIDIGSLRNGLDAICDVDLSGLNPAQVRIYEETKRSKKNVIAQRAELNLGSTPLLLLYRIDRDSRAPSATREQVATEHDLVGFAIIVPGEKLQGGREATIWIKIDRKEAEG